MNLSDQIFYWAVTCADLGFRIAICIVSLVAARRSSFRLVFYMFAVAAGLSVLGTVLALLFIPHVLATKLQPGELYRAIIVLQPLLSVVSRILSGIAFFMLVRRVLKLPTSST
ncbi:MAG: hypothetical protein ABIT76_04780 [Chthoniobacterales bacterium]